VTKGRVQVVDDPEALQALAHPLRVRILEALRDEGSAASVARVVRAPRQNVTYHLRELERAGLVRKVGERRKGNFVEVLYRANGSAVLVSPRAAWGDPRRVEALREQLSLENLVAMGERLRADAASLLDRAAFDGAEIASAAVDAEVHFADDAARAEFLREYLKAVGPVLRKYGRRKGAPYKVALAVYPDPGEGDHR
jgi:DNA-binding transcriptional ArsR family regulator